jgi:hypothetical protein
LPVPKGKDISIMIWGAIYLGGRSDLILMERDPESKRQGYSANSYLTVLKDQIPRVWQPGLVFVQDNAPIHTAGKVDAWLENEGIITVDWPLYSPDLNLIEHVWAKLKEWVCEHYPDLRDVGSGDEGYQALWEAVKEGWEALDQDFIDGLIKSMGKRCEKVIEAEGWYTKY